MDKKFLEVSQIKLRGIKEVEGMKFHDIEGGFGEGKKAMLVKEIAKIHGRELREINERINSNRKRFKDTVDIIDLLGIDLTDTEIKEFGFTQQAINSYRGLKAKGQTTGIYLLSERGYSKLLKILEDDVAWEQYEKLVDGYFNMRAEKKQLSALEQLQLQNQAILEVNEKVDKIQNDMPLFKAECDELQALVKKVGVGLMGGKNAPSYKNNSLRGKVYSDIQHQLRREFGVDKYSWIKHSQFNHAKEIISSYELPTVLKDEITKINNQVSFEEAI